MSKKRDDLKGRVIARHTTQFTSRCPANMAVNCYTMTVETDRIIPVDSIDRLIRALTEHAIFQEEIAVKVAEHFGATVTVRGSSGAYTTEVVASA